MPSDPASLKAWMATLSKDDLMALTQHVIGAGATGGLGSLSLLAARTNDIDLAPPPDEPSLLTLTIELRGSKPRIWRRLALPGDLSLDAVHVLFQAAMGWSDSHLHRFQPGTGQRLQEPYFITEFDEEEGDEGVREDAVRLDQVLREPKDQLTYLYDFGDGWEHRVTLESMAPLTAVNADPVCLGGARSCPPEDVGGIGGHHQVASWLRAGAPVDDVPEPFQDAEHAHDWLPVGYDPDEFDADETTAAMRRWATGAHLPWHGLPEPLADVVQGLRGAGWSLASGWLDALGSRLAVELDEDDVGRAARPWLAVLDAVGAGTTLTAAGYLPPVLVQQVARDAGVTDWWIGAANREDHTPPVAMLRETAQGLGLLRKAKGTLTPTARARAVADRPSALVGSVLERLPVGKGFEADAGWFLLLGLAAGEAIESIHAAVAELLTDRGWGTRSGAGVSASDVRVGAERTFYVLECMAGGYRSVDRPLLVRLARASLFGIDTSR